jgi:hypothetical protein
MLEVWRLSQQAWRLNLVWMFGKVWRLNQEWWRLKQVWHLN